MANFNTDVLKALGTGSAPDVQLFGLTPEQIANISKANIASEGQGSNLAMSVAGALGQRSSRRQQAEQFEEDMRLRKESAIATAEHRKSVLANQANLAKMTKDFQIASAKARALEVKVRAGDRAAARELQNANLLLNQQKVGILKETQRLKADEAVNKAAEQDKINAVLRRLSEPGASLADLSLGDIATLDKKGLTSIISSAGTKGLAQRKEDRLAEGAGFKRKEALNKSFGIAFNSNLEDPVRAKEMDFYNSETTGDQMIYVSKGMLGGVNFNPIDLKELRKRLSDPSITNEFIKDSAKKLGITPAQVLSILVEASER